MALWMPYADNTALDLTKPALTTVKEERIYSVSPPATYDQPAYGYPYTPYSSLSGGYQQYYAGYPYSTPATMTSVQMSPISGGSSCCSCEPATLGAPVSPVHTDKPAAHLSPPESPVYQAQRPVPYADVDNLSDDPDFQAFERDALRAMAEKNGGTLLGNNPRMRRAVRSTNQDSAKDAYRKQRERNNFAAKQSRDRRKLREIHLALKVSYLKKEVASLKMKLTTRVCKRCQQPCSC